MFFELFKASDPNFRDEVKLDSLEDLINFVQQAGTEIIIGQSEDGTPTITLYDDLIE